VLIAATTIGYKASLSPRNRALLMAVRRAPPDHMETTPRPRASRLEQALRAHRFAITAEITPPVSCNAQDLLEKALPLRGLVDAVNVTDGASARAHMSAPIAAVMLAQAGLEPILQLTCRDRNRLALEGELMGAAASGVQNLLCLTGDDPKAGDQPETKAVFDTVKSGKSFAYVITVCDEASAERCPIFPGVTSRLHWSFTDPSSFRGTEEERLARTREVRDSIRAKIEQWCSEVCATAG